MPIYEIIFDSIIYDRKTKTAVIVATVLIVSTWHPFPLISSTYVYYYMRNFFKNKTFLWCC